MLIWVPSNNSKKTSVTPICSQIKKELIMLSRIDINSFHCVQSVYAIWHHSHGIITQPAFPYCGQQFACYRIIWQMHRPILISRVASSHTPIIEKAPSLFLENAGRARKSCQNFSKEPSLRIAQCTYTIAEARLITDFKECVASVGGQPAPEVRAQHRRYHGSITTARFSRNATMFER